METIITAKKVRCDNCGNYIRQPKYHKELIGICCFRCFSMSKTKYYEICLFKYFNKIKKLEDENCKLRKKLNIKELPRMPEADIIQRKKHKSWRDAPDKEYERDEKGQIIIHFD